jgi:hypothetical protein
VTSKQSTPGVGSCASNASIRNSRKLGSDSVVPERLTATVKAGSSTPSRVDGT